MEFTPLPAKLDALSGGMLRALHLNRFRGFSDVHISGLSNLNIITGANSAGKTVILESLYLLLGRMEGIHSFPALFRRGKKQTEDILNFWFWLFPNSNVEAGLEIKAENDENALYMVRGGFGESNPELLCFDYWRGGGSSPVTRFFVKPDNYSNQIVSRDDEGERKSWSSVSLVSTTALSVEEEIQLYNEVTIQRDGEEKLFELMKIVEPRLKKIRYLQVVERPLIYADIGLERLIPISQMGQAFSRLLSIYLQVLATKPSVMLIDEVENGIHHSIMDRVWEGLAQLVKITNTQIFATTHSLECKKSAYSASQSHEESFAVLQLCIDKNNRLSVDVSSEVLG